MLDLPPKMAVQLASAAYQVREKNEIGRFNAPGLASLLNIFSNLYQVLSNVRSF